MGVAGYRMTRAAIELMLFKVGEETFGVELSQLEGVIQNIPDTAQGHCLIFRGQEIPFYNAPDVMPGFSPHARTREALILNDGAGLLALAVDGTQGVVEVTPGDALYAFPPQESADASPCRPWGVWDTGSRLVLLLEMTRATVH